MIRKSVNLIAVFATLAPFTLLLLGAMSSDSAIARVDFSQASFGYLVENLSEVLDAGIGAAILNTLAICLPMMLLQITSSVFAAFAFAWIDFRNKKTLYLVLIGSYLIPSVATFLPLFFLITALGFKGTLLGILLPFVLFSPYAIVLLRERFEAVPRDLIDQGRIDGLGNLGLLVKVVLPISRSFVALLAVITFVSTWNAFLWPRLIAGSEFPTITVSIAGLQSQYDSHWNLVLAASLLALIPAIAIFAFARKSLIRNPLAELDI